MNERQNLIIPMAVLGIAIIIAVFIFTNAWTASRNANMTLNVTGSAKMDLVSDLGMLSGSLSVQAATKASAYRALQNMKPGLIEYFARKGFPEDKLEWEPENSYANYDYDNNGRQMGIRSWTYRQRVRIQSEDVHKIKEISLDISKLVERGIYFDVESPEFHYTKLAEVKQQVQAMAAKDAMLRAEKIAEATGRKLGPMRAGRMGVLQITPRNSTMVSDYGVNDVSSIDKEITAVVSGDFQLE